MKNCAREKCTQQNPQPLTNFNKCRSNKDGLQRSCKDCLQKYRQEHRKEAQKYAEVYREVYSEKIQAANQIYNEEHREHRLQYFRKYNEKHREQAAIHRANNRARRRTRLNQRRKEDPLYRLATDIRSRVSTLLKQKSLTKKVALSRYLGCSIPELKRYLEFQFVEGMTWINHGALHPDIQTWQIDHIIPLSSAKTEEELYKLCHYTNLQPLWAKDNLKKGDKIL